MTLSLIIKNDGNQPEDTAVFKGIKKDEDGYVAVSLVIPMTRYV